MTTPTTLCDRIDAALPRLSNTSRRVALVLVDERERLGFRSATDIARLADTSDATVIRTVQSLGYRGLVELKSAVADELTPAGPTSRMRKSMATTRAQSADSIADVPSLFSSHLDALTHIATHSVAAGIEQAIGVITSARRVFVNARGVSVGIAEHTAAQLSRIGVDARRLGDASGVTADDILAIGRRDAVVLIASGSPQRWLRVVQERAAEVGAALVMLTDSIAPLHADTVVIRSGRGASDAVASHVPTIAVVEAIVIGVATRNPDRTNDSLATLERLRVRLHH